MNQCSFSKGVGSEVSCRCVVGLFVVDWSNLALPFMAWRVCHRAILSGCTENRGSLSDMTDDWRLLTLWKGPT
jgi:hypothetical protein